MESNSFCDTQYYEGGRVDCLSLSLSLPTSTTTRPGQFSRRKRRGDIPAACRRKNQWWSDKTSKKQSCHVVQVKEIHTWTLSIFLKLARYHLVFPLLFFGLKEFFSHVATPPPSQKVQVTREQIEHNTHWDEGGKGGTSTPPPPPLFPGGTRKQTQFSESPPPLP